MSFCCSCKCPCPTSIVQYLLLRSNHFRKCQNVPGMIVGGRCVATMTKGHASGKFKSMCNAQISECFSSEYHDQWALNPLLINSILGESDANSNIQPTERRAMRKFPSAMTSDRFYCTQNVVKGLINDNTGHMQVQGVHLCARTKDPGTRISANWWVLVNDKNSDNSKIKWIVILSVNSLDAVRCSPVRDIV